jgi:hypothetical protein
MKHSAIFLLASGLAESYLGGNGGAEVIAGATLPAGFRNYFHAKGNEGTPTTVRMVETAAGVFTRLYTYGVGGVSPYSGLSPAGSTSLLELSVNFISRTLTLKTAGFGCGGTSNGTSGGGIGGNGRIIIYY